MKPLDPYKDPITFGKYRGKTLDEIADIDPDYVLWLGKEVKTIRIPKSFLEAVERDVREADSQAYDIWYCMGSD